MVDAAGTPSAPIRMAIRRFAPASPAFSMTQMANGCPHRPASLSAVMPITIAKKATAPVIQAILNQATTAPTLTNASSIMVDVGPTPSAAIGQVSIQSAPARTDTYSTPQTASASIIHVLILRGKRGLSLAENIWFQPIYRRQTCEM